MMSSTIPRCNQCSRLTRWWGDYDPKTGWMGWCNICNAKWHWSEDAEPKISELVTLELVHESIVSIIYGYLAEDLAITIERVQRKAQLSAWEYFLVRVPCLQWRDTRFGRLALEFDTSDEDEARVCEFLPDLVNPMHTMIWESPKPFRLMVEFLGAPDFNCMFHS